MFSVIKFQLIFMQTCEISASFVYSMLLFKITYLTQWHCV